MSDMEDMLYLTEQQARSLKKQLEVIDIMPGVILWMRKDSGVLTIGSDGWPGVVRIDHDGSVEDDE